MFLATGYNLGALKYYYLALKMKEVFTKYQANFIKQYK